MKGVSFAEQMSSEVEKYRDFMDKPEEVARGILEQLVSDKLVIFPMPKPAKAYAKHAIFSLPTFHTAIRD